MNNAVSLEDINYLCEKYQVYFNITFETNQLVHKFGPIRWAVNLGEPMKVSELFVVAQLLAATFPEKVLQ